MRIIPSHDCESFTAILGVEDLVSHAILTAGEIRNGVKSGRRLFDILKKLRDTLPVPDEIVVGRAYFYTGDPRRNLNATVWHRTNPRTAIGTALPFRGVPLMRYAVPGQKGVIHSSADPKLYRDVTDYLPKEQSGNVAPSESGDAVWKQTRIAAQILSQRCCANISCLSSEEQSVDCPFYLKHGHLEHCSVKDGRDLEQVFRYVMDADGSSTNRPKSVAMNSTIQGAQIQSIVLDEVHSFNMTPAHARSMMAELVTGIRLRSTADVRKDLISQL